ncbi:FAST kinase domain-containing protein 4 [Caerostris darwini]|uniref:FAST kinase domain-containing protein 4 n=1 Tax=Caerostris darwini TaxID=1538125 RepID=A0AAV4XB84_9ARAC|nr:FAST kinase domain-containing protein 4 [Caerostris darwini]
MFTTFQNHTLYNFFSSWNFKSANVLTTHSVFTSPFNFITVNRTSSVPISETIQVSKYVQPLIHQSVNEILCEIDKKSISGPESVSILKALRIQVMFKGTNIDSFNNDARFKALCEIFEKNCSVLRPNLLVSGLRCLLEVGIPSNSPCIISAEERILSSLQSFSAFLTIRCLYYHHKYTETDLQKKVVLKLIDHLKINFYGVKSSSEVLMQKTDKPDLKETIDLFYAFKKLNFFEPTLFAIKLNPLESEILSIKEASMITGLVAACGCMRWRNEGVLEKCIEWIEKNLNSCSSRDCISFVLAVAALNYCTSSVKDLVSKMQPHFITESNLPPDILLNITWSLAILGITPKELLQKVLSPDFYKPLINQSDLHIRVSNELKLLNLKSVLKKHFPDCVFRCNLHLSPTQLPESSSVINGRNQVNKALSTIIPTDKFENQVTDSGIFIDAEIILNEKGKPLSLKEYGTASNEIKPLPPNSKRIALVVRFPKDFTHYTVHETGAIALANRLLKDAGYKVVQIPFSTFANKNNELQRLKFLSEKINANTVL